MERGAPLVDGAPEAGRQRCEIVPARRGCRGCLRTRRRLACSLATGAFVLLGASIAGYLVVPQRIIERRLAGAAVDVLGCTLAIGPNASTSFRPKVSFSVARSVLAVPLVSYEASVYGFHAKVFVRREGAGDGEADGDELFIGTFSSGETIRVDSRQDMHIQISGSMDMLQSDAVAKTVNQFVKTPSVTVSFAARVNIYAKAWDWLPCAFYGIDLKKAVTLPAFDSFRAKEPALDRLVSAIGRPGRINITATAVVHNPTPVTMILADDFAMQVYYAFAGAEYRLGTLHAVSPIQLSPGDNVLQGVACVEQTAENDAALRAIIAEYIGPQDGIQPAGGGAAPLRIRLANGTSPSSLVGKALSGLSVDINLREKPLYFLSAITADITAISSLAPPVYSATVHLRVTNPLPQVVHVQEIRLVAHHVNLTGPVLYHYNRQIPAPGLDPAAYSLASFETRTMDFRLHPMTEVSWDFLFSPEEILELLQEAAKRNLSVGISLNLTVVIDQGYVQTFHYSNDQLAGWLCFNPWAPQHRCGGLFDSSSQLLEQRWLV